MSLVVFVSQAGEYERVDMLRFIFLLLLLLLFSYAFLPVLIIYIGFGVSFFFVFIVNNKNILLVNETLA